MRAEVYGIRVGVGMPAMRYVVFTRVDLIVKQFAALVREEPWDLTCELPCVDADAISGGETLIWVEVVGGRLRPLSREEADIPEDIFQERLTDYFEEKFEAHEG